MFDKKSLIFTIVGASLFSCSMHVDKKRVPASGDRVGSPLDGSYKKINSKSCDLYQLSFSRDELNSDVKSLIESKGYNLVDKYQGEGSLILFSTKSSQGPAWVRANTSVSSTNGRRSSNSSVILGPTETIVNMAISKSFSKISDQYYHISKPIFESTLKDNNYPDGFEGKDNLAKEVLNEVSLGVLRSLPTCVVTDENSNLDAIVKNDDSKSLLLERLTFYKGNMFNRDGLLATISSDDFDDYDEYTFISDFYSMRERLNALDFALSFFDDEDQFISSNFEDRILELKDNGEAKVYGPSNARQNTLERIANSHSFFYQKLKRDKSKYKSRYEELKEYLPATQDFKNIEKLVHISSDIDIKALAPRFMSYDPNALFLKGVAKKLKSNENNKKDRVEFFVNFVKNWHATEPYGEYGKVLDELGLDYFNDEYAEKSVFLNLFKFQKRDDKSLLGGWTDISPLFKSLFIERSKRGVDINGASLSCGYSDFQIALMTQIASHSVLNPDYTIYRAFSSHPSYGEFVFSRTRACSFPEYFVDGMNNFQMALVEIVIQNRVTVNDVEFITSLVHSKADLEFKNAQGKNAFQLIDDFDAPKSSRRTRSTLEKTLKKVYKKFGASRK